MPALLELDHVGLSYHTLSGEIQALSQISFSVQEGEFVSLVGPSGCGKSTVLNLIAGLLIPEQGQITMQGLPREHSVLSVGYMLQKDHLFEWLTIYENVLHLMLLDVVHPPANGGSNAISSVPLNARSVSTTARSTAMA